MRTLANSEDPGEMLVMLAFYQRHYCLLRQNYTQPKQSK